MQKSRLRGVMLNAEKSAVLEDCFILTASHIEYDNLRIVASMFVYIN